MATYYNATRTFGDMTFSAKGYPSHEAALEQVYRRAFEEGLWEPPALRQKWWQLWRPKEHTDIEKKFVK